LKGFWEKPKNALYMIRLARLGLLASYHARG
jgi:hypothetical protein